MDKLEAVDCVIDLYIAFASETLKQSSANYGELSKHNNKKRLAIFVIIILLVKNYRIITSFCIVNKKHNNYCKSK